ncbi:MAG TPA: Na/Pi symporter [Trueperaceae bacterium]
MLFTMLGGLALFLLGVNRISDALESAAGPAARRWMAAATGSPFKALGTSTAVSAITQSGTALAVTALSLVASGLVPAAGGLAMSLGAKLGATGAIQLAAFNVSEYALPLVGIGFFVALWRRLRPLGDMLFGVGLLFLGLDLTVDAIGGLSQGEVFTLVVRAAETQPLTMVLVGALLGAVLGSANSAAAVAIGLVAADSVSMATAFALVAGGNVGSTFLPLVVSRGLDSAAQRVAISHVVVKGISALAVVFFGDELTDAIALLGGDGVRQVANAHTFFNLAVALVFTPIAGPVTRLVERIVPTSEDDSTPKYLRREALTDPALAIKLALRETVRISDQVAVMTELAVANVNTGKWDPGPIEGREAKTDRLTREVVDYLAELRRSTDEQDAASERLLLVATELENMGDQIRRLYRREERLRKEGVEFSERGRAELAETGALVLERMRLSFTALATGDQDMANLVIDGRPAFEEHVAKMRVAHLARLEERLPESRASSSHHLEVLTLLRQLDASVTRVAGWILKIYASA